MFDYDPGGNRWRVIQSELTPHWDSCINILALLLLTRCSVRSSYNIMEVFKGAILLCSIIHCFISVIKVLILMTSWVSVLSCHDHGDHSHSPPPPALPRQIINKTTAGWSCCFCFCFITNTGECMGECDIVLFLDFIFLDIGLNRSCSGLHLKLIYYESWFQIKYQ